jgi:hypothetical protein
MHVASLAPSRRVRVTVRHPAASPAAGSSETAPASDGEAGSNGTATVDANGYGYTLFPRFVADSVSARFVPRLRAVPLPTLAAWQRGGSATARAGGGESPSVLGALWATVVGSSDDAPTGVTAESTASQRATGYISPAAAARAHGGHRARPAASGPSSPFVFDDRSGNILLSRAQPSLLIALYAADAEGLGAVTLSVGDARLDARVAPIAGLAAEEQALLLGRGAAAHAATPRPVGALSVSLQPALLLPGAAVAPFADALVELHYAPAGQVLALRFAFDNGTGVPVEVVSVTAAAPAAAEMAPAGAELAGTGSTATPDAAPVGGLLGWLAVKLGLTRAQTFNVALATVAVTVVVIAVALRDAVVARPAAAAAAGPGAAGAAGAGGAALFSPPRNGQLRAGGPGGRARIGGPPALAAAGFGVAVDGGAVPPAAVGPAVAPA